MEGGSCRAAAASAVLPVPDELIVEILARLPAKSLCLCKCVSRAWRAFISDPANRRSNDRSSDVMSIYVLEDLDSEEWTWVFKQSIEKPDLFVPRMPQRIWDYDTAAFHPDSDLIFFYDWSQKRLVSYDMKHRGVHVICTLEVPYFEFRKFLPYVPLYSGALPSSCLN